jgi:hypothetical protein
MKETAKALVSKNKNELSAARTLCVSLDNADNVIEGARSFAAFAKGRWQPTVIRKLVTPISRFSEAAFFFGGSDL